ncbi:MAG: CpaF family protein [Anaerolineae bacterium]|nr:CpaF family protein [Anaerolineae bacterium]MDW8299095.1 CpaF family protein [Anaerolineae bacterium]
MGSPLLRRPNKPAEEARKPAPEVRPSDAPPPTVEKPVESPQGYIPPPKRRTTPRVAELRRQLRPKLLAAPNEADEWRRDNPEHQKIIVDRLNLFLQRANLQLPKPEYDELREALLDDILGWGAIDPLVRDRSYSEIMVNGPDIIFAERKGKLIETEYVFDDEEHADWVAQKIVRRLMRRFDREHPMTDARLPDGSRVHLIRRPSALQGITMTIRKFPEKVLTVQDLIRFGSLTQEVAEFLQACIVARLNIVVAGGTGSGKTTLLNVLSSFIPEDERIVTIEDAAELQLTQRHVVRLETAPPVPGAKDGTGQLVIRDLVRGSLRMRPDRIVIGECRGGEALDMLQAMNTGHDGSLTTVHANSPRDAIARLETLTLMAGVDLPVNVVRRQIASAVQLIIQQARLKDGSRKVVQISEIQGMEGDSIVMQDLFIYRTPDHKGPGPSYVGGGTLQPTGYRTKFGERLEQAGFKLSGKIFGGGVPSSNKA